MKFYASLTINKVDVDHIKGSIEGVIIEHLLALAVECTSSIV